jgi:nicotinamide N-methyltransferase
LHAAPDEANTLLAGNLFSPALLLAERMERGLLPVHGRTVIELGAGCGLPSLLAATRPDCNGVPTLVVATDYPDALILDTLRGNVARNTVLFAPGCSPRCEGYIWGANTDHLMYAVIFVIVSP